MNKTEYQKRKKEIRNLFEESETDLAEAEALGLVSDLHSAKKHSLIADLYHSSFVQAKEILWVFETAYALVEQGDKAKDEIVSRNYETLLSIVREREEINQLFEHALSYLPKENEFVIQKLQFFFSNAKKGSDLKDNRMPIPRWKFKVMMGTDEQKSLSLLDQWLGKGYIRKTGDRGSYNEHIYEINPYILKNLSS